jgi:hypothetical protein
MRRRYQVPACMEYGYLRALPATQRQVDRGDTFVPQGFDGLGHQFAALIRGIFLCYIFGYNNLLIQELGTLFPGDYHAFNSTDGIQIFVSAPESINIRTVRVNSFEADGVPTCPLDDIAIAGTIREVFLSTLPNVTVNPTTLYICAPGGEVTEKNATLYSHGQPPCHYYLDAMRIDGAPETVVMSNHGKPSPCVKQLVAKGAVYGSVQGPREDLARFIHSKRIVVSRTSFTTMVMLLSQPKDALYALTTQYSMCVWENHSRLNDDYDRFGPHHKCRATPEYDDKVLRDWHATDEQIQIMTTI